MIGARFAFLLAALVIVQSGCRCREDRAEVASLVEASGSVEGEHEAKWSKADPGAKFHLGDAVRTGATSSARLKLGPSSGLRLGADALLRFLPGREGKPAAVDMQTGTAEIEGEESVLLATKLGLARAEPGTRLRVRTSEQATEVEVVVGRATLVRDDTTELTLAAGEGVRVLVGSAEIERYRIEIGAADVERAGAAVGGAGGAPPAAEPDPPRAEDPTPAPSAAEPRPKPAPTDTDEPPAAQAGAELAGVEEIDGDTYDVAVPAGESATMHAVRFPLTVRVELGGAGCEGRALVEAASGAGRGFAKARRVAGRKGALVKLPAGAHRYRVTCGGRGAVVASGRLVVAKDAGTAPVAKSPPVNVIEADGRKYTVIFQGRPPALRFAWPDARGAGPFELHLEGGGRDRPRSAPKPELTIGSGGLPEGVYQLWFTSGDKASPKTSLVLRFQNAAVSAQIRAPAPGASWSGDSLEIAGVAVDGSRVSVDGQPIDTDGEGRFAGTLPPPPAGRSLAVRIEHPRGGVHYYVRHAVR